MKKNKKRLLIATDTFLPKYDGATVLINSVLPALSKHYDVTVLAPDYGLKKYPCITLVSLPLSNFSVVDYRLSKPCAGIIRREVKKADIVFFSPFIPIGFFTPLYAKKYGKKLISVPVSIEHIFLPEYIGLRQPFKAIMQFIVSRMVTSFYNKSDVIIVPAASAIKDLRNRGVNAKMAIAPLGIDVEKYKPPRSKTEAKAKFGLNGTVIGYYGRIAREKSVTTLVSAFAKLREKYGDSLHLLVVSPGSSIKLPKSPGMKHIIIKCDGKMPDVAPYLQAMDIYVLPSVTEAVSISATEAMACGVPIVSTTVGWMKELVDESKSLVFEKKNVDELAKKLEHLIKNKELRKKLGAHARKTVVKEHNLKDMVEKLEKAIDEA